MHNIIETIKSEFSISENDSIKRKLNYYWLEKRVFITFYQELITSSVFNSILEIIESDGESYPLSSDYIVLVFGQTNESLSPKDLEFMKSFKENVIFVLYNKETNTLIHPSSSIFPLRFSYKKVLKRIEKLI